MATSETTARARALLSKIEHELSRPELPDENRVMAEDRVDEAIYHLEMAIARARRGSRRLTEAEG